MNVLCIGFLGLTAFRGFEQPFDRSQAHGGCTIGCYNSVFYRQFGDPSALNTLE
jgi:hypothetical protein